MSNREKAFSARLNEACDKIGLPPNSRVKFLMTKTGATEHGLIRWLNGSGRANHHWASKLALATQVSVHWLEWGAPTKPRPDHTEGMEAMVYNISQNFRNNLLAIMEYKNVEGVDELSRICEVDRGTFKAFLSGNNLASMKTICAVSVGFGYAVHVLIRKDLNVRT